MFAATGLNLARFIECDTDGHSGLSIDEFLHLVRSLRMRPEIEEYDYIELVITLVLSFVRLFTRYAKDGGMSASDLKRFLHREQCETTVESSYN